MAGFYVKQLINNRFLVGAFKTYDLFSDMEPAGQKVYSGVFGSTAAGEGLYFTDCTTPATTGFRSFGADCREGQIWRQN